MTLYFDTSALAKLVRPERETAELYRWRAERTSSRVVTNVIGRVELHRFAARIGVEAARRAVVVLAGVDVLLLSEACVTYACSAPPPALRTLDALHVASASELADLTAIVSYDERMLAAARGIGLPTASPGAAA